MGRRPTRFFQRYVPLGVLGHLTSVNYVTGYRHAKEGRYGPILYDIGGGMVEKAAVEAVIGRKIDDAEILDLQNLVRAEARVLQRRKYYRR